MLIWIAKLPVRGIVTHGDHVILPPSPSALDEGPRHAKADALKNAGQCHIKLECSGNLHDNTQYGFRPKAPLEREQHRLRRHKRNRKRNEGRVRYLFLFAQRQHVQLLTLFSRVRLT